MSNEVEIQVPDIGDFSDVPIIEVHVAAGDTVAVEDPLITLESDKATMDVPATTAGDTSIWLGTEITEVLAPQWMPSTLRMTLITLDVPITAR